MGISLGHRVYVRQAEDRNGPQERLFSPERAYRLAGKLKALDLLPPGGNWLVAPHSEDGSVYTAAIFRPNTKDASECSEQFNRWRDKATRLLEELMSKQILDRDRIATVGSYPGRDMLSFIFRDLSVFNEGMIDLALNRKAKGE